MSAIAEAPGTPAGIPAGLESPSPDTPGVLLITAGPAEIEGPSLLEPLLQQARERGLRVVLRLLGLDWQAIDDWSDRITAFAQQAGDRVDAYQILGPEAVQVPARGYAYLLKNVRVAIRASGSRAAIVSPPLRASDGSWAEALFAEDAAPYLDALAAADLASLEAVISVRDRDHARSPVWVTDAVVDEASPAASAAGACLEGLAAGAQVILFDQAASSHGLGPTLSRLRGLFRPGLRAATPLALPFDPARATTGGETIRPLAIEVLTFFDPESRDGIAAYRASRSGAAAAGAATPSPAVRLPLRAPVESLELVEPETGASRVISSGSGAGAVAELPLRDAYLLLRYRVAAAAIPVKERTKVGAVSELTAEEIIAREREVSGVQDARLSHYEAKATVSIHYRLAQLNESVDLITDNRLFVKDGKQDYEQTALYVNGALWRGKSPPYLPYIQPGKVGEVPLDIALDERYRYRLEGRDKTDGRECYVLSFEPEAATATESLYSGRVYIDVEKFNRVRMEAKQTGLADPVRSNEVIFHYGPVPTSWGEAWLPQEMTGQMTFNVLGYNLVVERRASYTDYQLNPEGFEDRRAQAYESGRPLFRETDSGLFRLDTKNGQEELRSLDTPRNALLVFGTSVGDDGDIGFPFAGVNFFDFNFHGTGTQFNLAWAGPYVDLSWTQPNLFDTPPGRRPMSLALQGSFNAVETDEENQTSEDIPPGHKIQVLRELMRAGLSVPLGNFFKTTLDMRLLYQNFADGHDPDPLFVLPVTNVEGGLTLSVDYARLGYLLSAFGEVAKRSRWERWGYDDQSFDERQRDFTRLGAAVRKAFYLSPFNKVSLGLTGYEGRGLDRFSRFELGDFRSARVQGFNGSGIHFDRGLIGDVDYAFPLGKSMRVGLGVQHGFVNSEDDFGPGYERVTGSSLSLEFSGPWSTFVTVRASYGLASTIADTAGGGDLRVVFYRTFDKWSRRGGPGTPLSAPPPSLPQPPGSVSPSPSSSAEPSPLPPSPSKEPATPPSEPEPAAPPSAPPPPPDDPGGYSD